MDLEESCLLMRTSSRRSLALILLYSLYASSIGTRSSFWTFLKGEREQTELWGFCCEVLCFYFSALSTFAASIWNADFLLVEFPCRSVCWSLSAMSDLLSYCWAWWTWSSCSFTSANLFWQEMQCVYCQAGGASIRIFFLTKNWSRRNFCSF